MGDYNKALQSFSDALLSPDKRLAGKQSFQSRSHTGRPGGLWTRRTRATLKDLEDAASHYEATLKLNPDNEAAKANLEEVKKKIERLKTTSETETNAAAELAATKERQRSAGAEINNRTNSSSSNHSSRIDNNSSNKTSSRRRRTNPGTARIRSKRATSMNLRRRTSSKRTKNKNRPRHREPSNSKGHRAKIRQTDRRARDEVKMKRLHPHPVVKVKDRKKIPRRPPRRPNPRRRNLAVK